VDVIEGRAPRPGVSMLTLGVAAAQALYGLVRVYVAPVVNRRASARSRAATDRLLLERARLEDEAFEDAARLNAARRPLLGACWCGDPGVTVLPGANARVVCRSHYEVWRAA
jgi:hypothetical protein